MFPPWVASEEGRVNLSCKASLRVLRLVGRFGERAKGLKLLALVISHFQPLVSHLSLLAASVSNFALFLVAISIMKAHVQDKETMPSLTYVIDVTLTFRASEQDPKDEEPQPLKNKGCLHPIQSEPPEITAMANC